MMSDLKKKIWAVVSERGVEASGLSYDAAMNLMRTLETEKLHGLCVVTDSAARRETYQISSRANKPGPRAQPEY